MPDTPARGLKVKPLTPLILRPLTVKDWPGLFQAVGKALAGAVTMDFGAAMEEGLKALSYVGFRDRPAELAWVWVQRSLAMAVPRALAVPTTDGGKPVVFTAPDVEPIDAALAQLDLVLDQDFFDHPTWNPYVRTVGRRLRGLIASAAGEESADLALARFYWGFAAFLEHEWLRNSATLQAVIPRDGTTPLSTAVDSEYAWAGYGEWLTTQADRPVFEEAFGVRAVYVPLRAYADRDDGVAVARTVGMADDMLDHWLAAGRPDDAVRVLAGDPGAGKSTLARVYAADRFGRTTGDRRWRVVFAPLHHREFEAERPLTDAVAAYTREVAQALAKPLDRDAPDPTLLVLDGLDELSRAGRVGLEQMRSFMGAVGVLLESWNTDPKAARLMVLVCGRPIAADVARAAVRRPEAVLHLLPFVVDKGEILTSPAGRRLTLGGQTALLEADQREAWWGQYADAKGREAWAGVYAEIKDKASLTSVTGQPLLNYLVAFLRESTPDRTLPASRFDLYRRLTYAVWERRWGVNRVPTAGPLEFEHFLDLLEEMAVAAWHGGNIREIRVAAVKARLTPGQCARLTAVEAEVGHGLMRLMLAFFTRPRGGVQGDEAYEFTHKSFAEFLVASRVASHLDALAGRYARSDPRPDRRDTDALTEWAELFGPVAIDGDILFFVADAAVLRGRERVGGWRATVAHLLGVVVHRGMPMHLMSTTIKPDPTFRAMNDWALHAEFMMLSTLRVCRDVTNERARVAGLADNLGYWVGARWAEWVGMTGLDWLDLSDVALPNRRMSRYAMEGVSLARADLTGANLLGAVLIRTILFEASLIRASLTRADLTGASLIGASLFGANLTRADLSGADVAGADVAGADLSGATLFRASLSRASLSGASLSGANLTRASLSGADLTGANLTGANLTGANLTGANLTRADLSRTTLTGATLTGATLTAATLTGAMGVTHTELVQSTRGDPLTLPDGQAPAPNWRTKGSPRKRRTRKPKNPGPLVKSEGESNGTEGTSDLADGHPSGPAPPSTNS